MIFPAQSKLYLFGMPHFPSYPRVFRFGQTSAVNKPRRVLEVERGTEFTILGRLANVPPDPQYSIPTYGPPKVTKFISGVFTEGHVWISDPII